MATSQALKNAQTLRPFIDPSTAPWNADPTGNTDATAAFNAAYAAARQDGSIVAPAPGAYLFNGSLDPSGTTTWGPGVFSREQSTYTDRSVVFMHNSAAGALFAPTSGAWNCHGITFYDPNQLGTGLAPVVRPAMIKPVGSARLIDVTFDHNKVINAYRLFEVPVGSLGGNVKVHHNDIYAIEFVFLLNANCPESIFVDNNIITPGVYQTVAVFANGGMLTKWTAANGCCFAIDCAGTSVDGLKTSNNLIYGYRYGWRVTNGTLNLPSSTGDTYDKVPTLIEVIGSAQVAGMTFSGGLLWSQQTGDLTTTQRAVNFSTSGVVDVDFGNITFRYATGSWIIDDGTGFSNISHCGYVGPWGQATGAAIDYYAFGSSNPNSVWNIKSTYVNGVYANSVGVYLDEAARCNVTGVAFNSCKVPVQLTANMAAFALTNLVGCTSQNTISAKSVLDSSASDAYEVGCRWDQPSDITPSV